jgi:PiT family inorganic phosphate transporter
MDWVLVSVVLVVLMALLFDFTNGFHDAANAIATTVATKAMPPRVAALFAAVFNFLPAFVGSVLVASAVAKAVDVEALASVPEGAIPLGVRVTFAALLAAIAWNYFTWWGGIPSSSSHALIGGLVGAGLAAGGLDVINWGEVEKVVFAIAASPAIAFVVAVLAWYVVKLVLRITKWHEDHEAFRWAQIFSAGAVSWGHGSNDAQKTMGVIAATLASAGYLTADASGKFVPPTWVVFSAAAMISLGTYYGGWAIIDTMGLKITRLTRASGVAANVGAITAIFGATNAGIPISTTHAAASSIMGSGVGSRRRVNWLVMRDMVIAWVVTLPAVALAGFLVFQLTELPGALAWMSSLGALVALVMWAIWLMRRAEGADEVAEKVDELAEEREHPPAAVSLPGPHGHEPGEFRHIIAEELHPDRGHDSTDEANPKE